MSFRGFFPHAKQNNSIMSSPKLNQCDDSFDVILFECEWPAPPIYLHDYLEHVFKIWHGFSTNVKKIFFCVRNFCRPPETPLWSEISVSEKNF